jgi:hypothetical protein
MALPESEQIARFIIGDAVDPATIEDADPFERQSSKGSLVLHAASLARVVEGARPEGARDGLPDPLDEGLAKEGWALIAPVDGGLVAAAFGSGATPAYCWSEAASAKRSRRSPKATSKRGARAAPAPGRARKRV